MGQKGTRLIPEIQRERDTLRRAIRRGGARAKVIALDGATLTIEITDTNTTLGVGDELYIVASRHR